MSVSTDRATRYARGVAAGKIPAVRTIKLAAKRHLDDLASSKTAAFPYCYAPEAARRFEDFCEEHLRAEDPTKGDGTLIPFRLTDFQAFVAGQLYGWQVKGEGVRRFREVFLCISKSSGKSPLAAACALYALTADGEYEAAIQICARDYAQAGPIAQTMGRFVECSPMLSERVQVQRQNDPQGFTFRPTHGGVNRAIRFASSVDASGEGKGRSGPRPSFVAIDECQEAKDDSAYMHAVLGVKNRRQPIIMLLCNAATGFENLAGRIYHKALSTLEGTLDQPRFLACPVVADEGMNFLEDESCWEALHPDLGFLISREDLRIQVQNAEGTPSQMANILRLYGGVFSPTTEDTLFTLEAWKALETDEDVEQLAGGLPCYLGLDLSQNVDLSALTAVWADFEKGRFLVKCWPFLPADGLLGRKARENVDYDVFAREGHLTLCEGPRIEYAAIAKVVLRLAERFEVRALAYDRYRMREMRLAMQEAGVDCWHQETKDQRFAFPPTGIQLIDHGQGFAKPWTGLYPEGSISALENWIANEEVVVQRNPLLRYHAVEGSVVMRGDGVLYSDNRKFIPSEKRVIRNDCIVATVMACGAANHAWTIYKEEQLSSSSPAGVPEGWYDE